MNTQQSSSGPSAIRPFHGWLNSLGQTSRSLEKQRTAPRYSVCGPVYLGMQAAHGDGFLGIDEGWATDVSCTGIGILVERPLEAGRTMQVNLEPLMQQSCVLMMRVVYCRKLLANTYRIGGVFVEAGNGIATDGAVRTGRGK